MFLYVVVSASVATHQHMCVDMPQQMCKCEVILCVSELRTQKIELFSENNFLDDKIRNRIC